MKKIALVITPICPQAQRKYGVRLERRGSDWFKTWAFTLNPNSHEDFQNSIPLGENGLGTDTGYNGCPFCQSPALIQCGDCSGIYCYHGESISVCPLCGNEGMVTNEGWDEVSAGGY